MTGVRRIELEGCFNFRDLGGYGTEDGRTVAWGKLFRADSVHLMTQADASIAKEKLGLRTLIDLRNEGEISMGGIGLLAEDGLARSHFPVSGRRGVVIDTADKAVPASDRSPDTLVANYLALLENSADLLVDAVTLIAGSGTLPAVFFCSAGKDRTGILSAVVLGALGVEDETIVADYVLTTEAIDKIITRLGSLPGAPAMYREVPTSNFAPYAETMERMVDEVRKKYGSFAGYLEVKGATPRVLEELRAELLDP